MNKSKMVYVISKTDGEILGVYANEKAARNAWDYLVGPYKIWARYLRWAECLLESKYSWPRVDRDNP
jgi:hypothetical protein